MPDRVSLTAGAWITFSLTPPFPSSVWLPFIHPGASTDPHCASVSWHPLVFSFPCLWALHLELVYSWLYILIRLPLLIPSLRHTFFYTEVDRRWAHSCNLPATVPGEMPHEGFAVDWIAPKDVISRQPSWIIFPGLPCLAGCIHLPIKYNLRLPCGLPLHSNHPPHPPTPHSLSFLFFLFTSTIPHRNYSFTTCRTITTLWGRPADGRSDWLSVRVYFLVVRLSDEIKHCFPAFVMGSWEMRKV